MDAPAPPAVPAVPLGPVMGPPRPVDVFWPSNFKRGDRIKLFTATNFLGYVSADDETYGTLETDMTSKRIADWTNRFTTIHLDFDHMENNIRGGTLNDYVVDLNYDPVFTLGENLPDE